VANLVENTRFPNLNLRSP